MNKAKKFFKIILVLIIISLLTLILFNYFKNRNPNQWQSYQDPQGFFSFDYPPNWQLSFEPSDRNFQSGGQFEGNPEKKQDIIVSGPEGIFRISWVDSYGGGCSEGYKKINLKNMEEYICHEIYSKSGGSKEIWRGLQKPLEKGLGITIRAETNAINNKNRELMMKIFSSTGLYPKD